MANLLFLSPSSFDLLWLGLTLLFVLIVERLLLKHTERKRKSTELWWFTDLHLLSRASAEGFDPKQLAELALRTTLKILETAEGFVLFQTQEPEGVSHASAQGLSAVTVERLNGELLRPYLASCGERWGNLMVFPDLSDPGLAATWQRDPLFQEFRLVLLSEGLKSLVVVGLRVREKSYGAFLVASRKPRTFTPQQLRVTLAIGNQMGVALENWALHKAAGLHNEELRNLHFVGEALRSTFDLQSQVEILRRELRGLLGAAHFSLALQESSGQPLESVVALEDSSSEGLAPGPEPNGLAEQVARSRAPLRITQDLQSAALRLGVEFVDPRWSSWCGVPIRFSDGSVGVLEVAAVGDNHSITDRQFELMQVLGDEITGAIENARLFQKEQRRASHLALLNDLGRKATAMLNPQELLPGICHQVRSAFGYDLARIEVLDRDRDELVVEAEAGYGQELQGQRSRVGEGLSGTAAETGEPVLGDALHRDGESAPFHRDARSALSLPLKYGDKTLGVLSLESRRHHAFTHQDVLTLRTLTDQLAIALHNARAFQVALDQAITDGVTNLKTHRYFMEALGREWRHSTRTGRVFSVIMIDLDGFKQVNDRSGHLAGDKVLAAAAGCIAGGTRQSNLVARYGGDEFAILMPEANTEQALVLAERLCTGLASDPSLAVHGVTASFGIASFPLHGPTPEEILSIADSGMYLAKHQKGNRVRVASFTAHSAREEAEQQLLEAHLGAAARRLSSTGPEVFEHYLQRLEQMKRAGSRESPSLMDTMISLAFFVDAKEPFTQGHSHAVSLLAKQIARQVGLGEVEVEDVGLAGILHDVGKIGVPEDVLSKPALLTPEEYEVIKAHAALGGKILEPLKMRATERIRSMVHHHHEFFNGLGYPLGLKGQEIPLGARILSVADSFDTMVSERVYKRVRSVGEAIDELRRCSGTQFDPAVVDAFVRSLELLGDPRKRATVEEAAS